MFVAVFIDRNGMTAKPETAHQLAIYKRTSSGWAITKTIRSAQTSTNSKSLSITGLIDNLIDCTIIVASTFSDETCAILHREGYTILEYHGNPMTYLSDIAAKTEDTDSPPEHPNGYMNYYKHHGAGVYSINAKIALFNDGSLSSKELLVPFLDGNTFKELHATFAHLPLWFKEIMTEKNMKWELVEHKVDTHVVLIRPQQKRNDSD